MRAAPHRVSIYRRSASGKSAYAEVQPAWGLVAEGVPFDVQLSGHATGEVVQLLIGRDANARYQSFAPHGTDQRPDDGVLITASEIPGMIGRRFDTREAMDWGARGGVQGVVEDSDEDFGEDPQS
jgi:hypothetical protein